MVLFLSHLQLAKGQMAQPTDPHITLQTPEAITLDAALHTFDFEIGNNSAESFEGEIHLTLPTGLSVLGNEHIALRVAPGKKRFVAIRLQSQALSSMRGQQLQIQLTASDGRLLHTRHVNIDVPDKRAVILQDVSDQQYLKHVGDSIAIRVRATNQGTTDEPIKVLFSSPDRVGNTTFQEHPLFLPSGADTLITLRFATEKYMLVRAQYTIRVTGIFQNGDVFGNATILLPNITANRNYQQMFMNDGNLAAYSRNFIDVQIDNMLGEQQTYYLRAEGEYRVAEGRFRYTSYLTQIGNAHRPTLSNTFAEFNKGKNTYTIGNIQESMEAPLYGRGAKFTHQDTSAARFIMVGAVQRSTDLLGYHTPFNPGYTAFAHMVLGEGRAERHRYESQLFYDKNNIDSTKSFLWSNSFDLLKQKYADKMQLRLFAAAGLQQYDGQLAITDSIVPSAALGLRFDQRWAKWTFTSDNFVSTPYYTGNRRGALQFTERVNRSWGKMSAGLGYTFFRYEPSYFSEHFFSYSSQSSRWDLNLYAPINQRINISVMPSYNRDRGSFALPSGLDELATASWRLLSTTSYRSRSLRHTLNWTMEAGIVSIDGHSKDNMAIRTDVNYNYRRAGLYGSFQRGAFQVSDVLAGSLVGRSFGNRLSVGARLNGNLLHEKLYWTVNTAANYNSGYGRGVSGTASFNYRVLKNTIINGLLQYHYNVSQAGNSYQFNNLRIGIRQNLKAQNIDRPRTKTGDLRVRCFYDHNGNGVFDEGDEAADNYTFTVRDVLFVTDQEGWATFKKLPYGRYTVFVPRRGPYLGSTMEVEISRSRTDVHVALRKGGLVRGSIRLDYTPGLSLETDLSLDRYTIIAKDASGTTVEARTDKHGRFELGLPVGTYSFYLDVAKFPQQITIDQEAQTGTVEIGETLNLAPFVLHVKTKKIEVKRFGK